MIPYSRHSIDQADIDAVVAALESGHLTQGPEVDGLERDFAELCDVSYAVAFSSGTAALHAAAFAAGVRPGQDVLTSSLTFVASANCAAYLGARPIFADIEPETLNVSAGTIADAITPKTTCVIPVHFAGLPIQASVIREAVGKHRVIIEDAAHALGAQTNDGPVGNCAHSDMTIFSLHASKAITSAEGGIVTTRDEALAEKLRRFRNHGFTLGKGWYREQRDLGFNYRLSDLHAALGRSQLNKEDLHYMARVKVANRYRRELADVVELPPHSASHVYHLFVIRHPKRQVIFEALKERGIASQVHYTPVYLNPWYRETYGYGPGLCPNAEAYYVDCLSLPCFPDLTDEQQTEVIEAVRDVIS